MRFDEAQAESSEYNPEQLKQVCIALKDKANFVPFILGPYTYYRRGTGGIYLYRVLNEDFRMPRERKKH